MPFPDQPAGALTGLRVLDLTQVMSGPYCTMMLADMGADVIKVENPAGGDQTRVSWGYAVQGDDSRAFLALNRNKRSVRIDLKDEAGREDFYRLVRTADVVVENFRPGVTARLGIDYETLTQHNPALIYASISGFGQTGPYSQHPGYDLIAQGMSGVMSITGEPDGDPVKCGLPVADLGAGMFTAFGIVTAYASRLKTGEGQYLEVSLFEAALAMSVWESTEYWATGQVPQALGSANRMSAPYQAFRASDGYLTIGANNERLWTRLCDVLGAPELVQDERFTTNTLRMGHRAELVATLTPLFATRTVDEWVTALLEAGVPAGPIRDYSYVLDSDPHVAARGAVTSFEHPVEGTIKTLASPVRLQGTPPTVRSAPPLLGEHDGLLDEVRVAGSARG
ncbi:CoA transferase [Desertihabitans brevis]|uniref:CoA transferase n=1 Tax=Desertihabitans brevis TaxID=2268447 RepID=A0A367YVZ5_9ACTN|nr:CoA transferase [Desertihabitans brevis]RCK69980.1 CoA transferase [Desertihabitans brevis]